MLPCHFLVQYPPSPCSVVCLFMSHDRTGLCTTGRSNDMAAIMYDIWYMCSRKSKIKPKMLADLYRVGVLDSVSIIYRQILQPTRSGLVVYGSLMIALVFKLLTLRDRKSVV